MIKNKNVLNGREIAEKYLNAVSRHIVKLKKDGKHLTLATFQVGQSKDTALYAKALDCLLQKLGIKHIPSISPEKISETALFNKVAELNVDAEITGIMIFSPLPGAVNAAHILNAIDILKDIEGRRALTGFSDRVVSPTANAVLALLEETGVDIAGKEAVVIGHSDVVGKPTAILLLDKMATVTVCHVKTKNLKAHVERADILVAAAGKAHLVKGEWIKPGAVVIDVGENVLDGKIVGDVEFESAKERAAFISPVPGGVGPVTNVMLVKNLLQLQKMKEGVNGNS